MRLLPCLTLAAFAVAPLLAQPVPGARRANDAAAALAWQRYAAQSHATLAALHETSDAALPPPPAGVTDLQFAEFFGPIGDRGLEYSAKLRALEGRTVRLVGFMVREQDHAPGLFLFAGWPLSVTTKGPCSYDDSPPTAVHVRLPTGRPVPYRPGRIVLVGRLELGPRPEADGRNSTVRLFLDAAAAAPFTPAAQSSAP
jgi:hypothetical protein